MTVGGDDISAVIRNIKLVLNHDCLCHVVQYLVGVNELSSLLQVKDSGNHSWFETIFELEVTGEMFSVEFG